MKMVSSVIGVIGARLVPNRRLLKEVLANGLRWRFLVVNAVNFLLFKARSDRTFSPTVVVVEASDVCNLKCPFCYRTIRGNERGTHYMTPDLFRTFIARNKSTLSHVQFGMWGEPLTNKWLPELVAIAADAGVGVYMVTNATLLTEPLLIALGEAGVQQITLSFDSIDDEYEALRGVPFANAQDKLAMVLRYKQRFGYRVVVSAVAVNEKYGIEQYNAVFSVDGVDHINYQPLYSEERMVAEADKAPDPCYRLWHTAAIYSDGDVSFCAFDQAKELKIGNIADGSLRQIFNNPTARQYRRNFLAGSPCSLCKGCNPYYR